MVRLIDVDSPSPVERAPPLRAIPPPYVAPATFNMTELLPVVDKIAITETNAKISPLFKLPSELRNQIFKHVLGGYDISFNVMKRKFEFSGQDSGPPPCLITPPPPSSTPTLHSVLNLTLVSRQTYTETAMLPFTLNTFVFTQHTDTVEKGLAQTVLPAQRDAIATVKCHPRMLFFDFWRGTVATRHCMPTLKALKGLRRVIFVVGGIGMDSVDLVALKVKFEEKYEGVEGIFEETRLP